MDILVIGAGPGGLAAAIGLLAAGHDVRVLERQRGAGIVGSGLVLAPNGLRALDHLDAGVAQAIRDLRVPADPSTPYTTLTSGGKVLGVDSAPERFEQRWGDRLLPVLRRDLMSCLRDALPTETLTDGHTVKAVRIDGGRGVAVLHDGTELEADLVIGADGVWSTTRKGVDPSTSPRYIGVTSIRGVGKADDDPYPNGFMTHGPGRTLFAATVPGGTYWAVTLDAAEREWPSLGVERAQERLLELLGDWHDPVRSLVRNTAPDALVVTDLHEMPAMRRWSLPGITLLGDAAHPMPPFMGMGANVALEDAATLVACIAAKHDDLLMALRQYEDIRRRRVGRIAGLTRRIGQLTRWHNPLAVALRNGMMRSMMRRDDLESNAWLYDWRLSL